MSLPAQPYKTLFPQNSMLNVQMTNGNNKLNRTDKYMND